LVRKEENQERVVSGNPSEELGSRYLGQVTDHLYQMWLKNQSEMNPEDCPLPLAMQKSWETVEFGS
jgi:hypothetical protein